MPPDRLDQLSAVSLCTLSIETFLLALLVAFLTWRQQAHYWLRLRYSVVVYLLAVAVALGARTDQSTPAIAARVGAMVAGVFVFLSIALSWRALFTKPKSGELERRNLELALQSHRLAFALVREAEEKIRALRHDAAPEHVGDH